MTYRDVKNRIDRFVFGRLLDQFRWVLEGEIVGSCATVLDLGCGSTPPSAI